MSLLPLFIRKDLGTTQFVCQDKKIFSYHSYYENLAKYSWVKKQADRGKSMAAIFSHNWAIC